MDYNELNLKVRIPNIGSLVRRLPRTLLPTPGNVIFTVLIVGCLLWANSVGAFFAPVPFSAASSVATIPYQGRLADSITFL